MPDINLPANGKKLPLLAVAAAVIALALGGGLGYSAGVAKSKAEYKSGYDTAWAEAKTKVSESRFFTRGPSSTTIMTGRVLTIGKNELTMEVPQTVQNPLENPAPTTRTVRVSADTKIIGLIALPQEEVRTLQDAYRAEQEKFMADLRAGKQATAPPQAPQLFEQKDLSLADLAVNNTIVVTAADDISLAESFPAVSIQLNTGGPSPALRPGAPPTPLPPAPTLLPPKP